MKKIFPLFIFLAIVVLFFRPLFHNQLPIPSDTIIGLYYPFRDLYVKTNPNGITYKNFLITDPVRQLYPWRSLSIALEEKFQLPLWNPYVFAGSPLLANFQSAVFYPLNIFLFLLPFSDGWSILIVLQPILAGIFLYWYLRNLKLSITASLLGGITFAFCGFSIAWMQWNTLVQVALWLPLILLATEYLVKKITARWIFVLMIAEISQVFAGHIQTLFYSLCISNIYLIGRIMQLSYQRYEKKDFFPQTVKIYIPFFLIGVGVCTITAIQWVPTLQLIQLSARNLDQSSWQQAGWFIPWQNLAQYIAPDFFGNPTTLNYWGIWNYAEFIGYVGILPLLLAFVALIYRRDKKTLFFGILCFLSLIFALPTGISAVPFILKIPFVATSQPTRLIFVIDFSLSILAALGWDQLQKQKRHIIIPSLIMSIFFIILWISVFWGKYIGIPIQANDILVSKRNMIFPTLLFGIVMVLLFVQNVLAKKKESYVQRGVVIILLAVLVLDLFHFADKFEPFTSKKYLFPSTPTLTFLQKNVGNYRYMTTDSQIFPPNFSVMYRIQSVDGYDPLYLQSYAEFIAASERGEPNIQPPFGFNRIITPHNINSKILNLLGVKYVLSLSDLPSPQLRKVFQEGKTRIYENMYVLSRAFFVRQVVPMQSNQETIKTIFDKNFDAKQTALVNGQRHWSIQRMFSVGTVRIIKYTENSVIIQTKNTGDGFLVLTDMAYPTWQVMIDGSQSNIVTTDYTLRGVVVPKGEHTVIFSDTLL